MTIEVSIIVPDRVFWKDTAKEIILPTLNGQMGVLTNHIPLLTGLDTGVVFVRQSDVSGWQYIVVTGGFALVNSNKLTILVNEAEFGSEIKLEDAEADFNASKEVLDGAVDEKKKLELISQFKKARARLQIAQQAK